MKEAKILILNFNPGSVIGATLEKIVSSCTTFSVQVQQESQSDSPPVSCRARLPKLSARERYDLIFLVLSAIKLKPVSELLQSRGNGHPVTPVIVAVDVCKPDEMFSLLKLGVADFITSPLREINILPRIRRLLEQKMEEKTLIHKLKEKLGLKTLVGESSKFFEEIKKIPTMAKCDASVLICGETGTGKELCARAIHYLSSRASQAFIPLNCGAIPTELVENELFGHVQGAFTGASSAQSGLIGQADNGTLFFDDINCLALKSQAKLLRFIQEKEYRKLGSTKMSQANVRIIASSNVDMLQAIEKGEFRQDLYYRLNILPITLPALRDRREDIPLLSRYFIHKYAVEHNTRFMGCTPPAMQKLMFYDWPGNVRELEHVVERAVLFSNQTQITEADVILPNQKSQEFQLSFKEAKENLVNRFEKDYVEKCLSAYQGNITRAAQAARKNRRAFWQLIRKHNIDVQTYKSEPMLRDRRA